VEKAAYDDIVKSRDNSLIKLARALQDKKEREASGLALLEGVRLIGDALSQEVPISAVIYSGSIRTARRAPAAVQDFAGGIARSHGEQ